MFRALLTLTLLSTPAPSHPPQTFRNLTPHSLILVPKPGPSPHTFLLTHHLAPLTDEVDLLRQHPICPATGLLPRLRLAPGESVDFQLTTPAWATFAHCCLYQEATMLHLARLDFLVQPDPQHPRLSLQVSPTHAQALQAVERHPCCLATANPGWDLAEAGAQEEADAGCCW